MECHEPPNGERRRTYAGEKVLTADRQCITDGLRVYTNNLDRGTVDLSSASYEWHGGEGRYVLWFDVVIDTLYTGESAPVGRRVQQSDDRVATRFNGKAA